MNYNFNPGDHFVDLVCPGCNAVQKIVREDFPQIPHNVAKIEYECILCNPPMLGDVKEQVWYDKEGNKVVVSGM